MAYKTDNSLLYAQAVQAARKRRQEEWEDYATRNGLTVYPQTISYEERQSLDASMSDFANRANNFLKRSSLNLRGMDYDNYKDLYQYNAPNYSKLRTEAAELRFQVEKNKDFLNKKEYERYMSLLDEFSESSSQIHDLTENTRETMSQFKSRDEYDLAMSYLKSSADVAADRQAKQKILDNRPSRAHLIEQNLRSGMRRKDAIADADAKIAAYYQNAGFDSVTDKDSMKAYLNTMEGIEANARLSEREKEARENPAAAKQKAQGLDLINRLSRLNNDSSLVEAAGYTPDGSPKTLREALANNFLGRKNISTDLAMDANAYALAESNVRRQSVLDELTNIALSDPAYKQIVNDSADEKSKAWAARPAVMGGPGNTTDPLTPYMTDEEYSVYKVLSPDNQKAYYAALEEALTQRAAENKADKLEGHYLAEIAARIPAGMQANIENVGKFFSTDDYINNTKNDYYRQNIAADLENIEGFKGKLARGAGNVAETIGNMIPSIIVSTLTSGALGAAGAAAATASKVGSILGTTEMGLAAAGQTYAELLNSGRGKELARTMSIIQGVWEGASEYYLGSIEALGANRIANRLIGTSFEKTAEKVLGGWAKFFVNSGIDALQEGAEEVIQDIGGTMLEKLVTGEWNPSTPEEKIEEFLLGAASAFFMNAPGTATDIVNARQVRNQYRGQEQELVNKGLQSPQGSDSRRLAEIYQEQMDQNRNLSGLQIQNLVEANGEVSQRRAELADLSTNIDEDRIDKNAKDIVRVKSIGNDSLTVVYDDGTEASNADIKFKDKGEAAMFQNFVDKGYDVEAAEQVMKLARESDLPMTEFVLAANEAFGYGRINANLKNVRPVFMGDLNTADQQTIYEMGRSYADRQLTREQLKSAGILRRSIVSGNISLPKAYNDLSNIQKASVTALAWVTSKITKNKVVFYNSVKNENGDFVYEDTIDGTQIVKGQKASNGMYSNGTVYIDLNAGNKGEGSILWTASHEFTHLMKENAQAEYKALADFVTNRIGNIDDLVQYQMAKAEQSGHAIDETVAEEEVIADAMSEMLASEDVVQQMLKLKYENRPLFNRMKNFFTRIYERVTKEYSAISEQLLPQEARILRQFGADLEQVKNLFSEGLVAVGNNGVMMRGEENRISYADRGLAEDGRRKYESNFPLGTPKSAKSQRVLDLVQNVWSKKPIDLVISNGVTSRKIQAQFDPTVDPEGIIPTDASKLAGGNRHGSSKEQRVALDLADDYYQIATESKYNYSKKETGKETSPHRGVKQWHYFVDEIYFAEQGSDQYEPYTISINVKEKDDGTYVYSYSAKKEFTTLRRTLYADEVVTRGDTGELFYEKLITDTSKSQEPSSEISYLARNDGEAAAQGEYSDDATASFEDSNIATKNQIRTPYTEGTKAWEEFTSNLSPEAKQTHDMFYNFFTLSKLNNTTNTKGDRVKKLNISSVFLTAQQWNEKLEQSPDWKACAEKLAASLPENVRKAMHFNLDGTLEYTDLEKEFKMQKSLAQRLVDSLGYEVIDSEYELGGKKIKLSTGGAVQSVGGEAYRRALIAETRKLYNEGRLKQVNISTMSKDRWGSLGFLAENQKTGASGDFTTICPQMMFNKGCFYCYRRAALESGVNNKLVAESVWYTGEILRIKDEDIKELNKKGGLRIQSFGDWMPHFSAQLADVIYDAEQRGLQVKIITKEPSMIEYVARLREQGLGKNLYFNLSADYAIEKFAPTGLSSVETVNEKRPYMRRASDNTFWWKRAMTVEEAAKYREKYPWVNVRIVATTLEEYIRGLKDPNVQVVTGYHGHIREWERIDSTTGEQKVQVEPLGDAGMPRFYFNGKTWGIEFEGKTKTHKRLAEAIQAEGLERDYYNKACCITGRCSECEGKCGALANNFYVKNATNADAESVAYWEEHMTNPQEDLEEEMVRAESSARYSLRAVDPVQTSNESEWRPGFTTEQAREIFPNLWAVDAEESDTKNPTSVKVTLSSYRKIYGKLKAEGFNGTILDASSGLGYGTEAGIDEYGFDVEDIEPYPGDRHEPTSRDYSTWNKKYDVIISNAVLNVLPQEQRDALVVKMGELLNPGGRIFVNVRGVADVRNAKSKLALDEANAEYVITNTGSYQKGFRDSERSSELVSYLQDALGDGYTVERSTKEFGSGVWATVTKKTDESARHSIREIVGKSGTNYGRGVYLDSDLFEGLTPVERKQMLKLYVDSMSGEVFDAIDPNGNTVPIRIAENDRRYRKAGTRRRFPANHDLATKNSTFRLKQETVVLVNEAIETSFLPEDQSTRTPNHEWLDENGWEHWKVYVQDTNNNVYLATLNVALSSDGLRRLYDIDPVEDVEVDQNKKAEWLAKSSTSPLQIDNTTSSMESQEKNSLRSTVDSSGNNLTQEQAEYFKNSKVRDEEGNLLLVYHGTDADFTVFDPTKSRSTMDIQGMFFSPWEIDAGGYGNNVGSYYLNITNPASEAEGYAALNRFKGQNEAGRKAREFLIAKGYDGVNNGNEEYVAFYPEQVKRADNAAPTSNPDIRYSDRINEPYSYDSLVSKPNMPVTKIDTSKVSNRADTIVNARKNAGKIGTYHENGSIGVVVKDTGDEVILSSHGLRHSLTRKLDIIGPITEQIGRILENSIKLNELIPKDMSASGAYVLIGIAENNDGDRYVVRSIVNRYTHELEDMDVLYAINAKKEPAATKSPAITDEDPLRVTGSEVRIADLLDSVNRYYPDILPEDVLRHYGYEERPSGELGSAALFQNRDMTIQQSRELLANALESTIQNEDERKLLETYKSQMKILNDQQSELDAVRKQIADISFTAGSDRSRLPALREKSAKLSAAIQRQDKKLLKLESMQSLKNVLDREITKARRKVLEEYRAGEKDRQISRDLRTRVKRQVEEFRKRLTNPTDRRYIPRGLVGGIVSVYDAIDQTGVRQDTKAAEKYRTAKEALNALKAEYDKLEYDADNDFSSEFNRDFSKLISDLAESVGDTPLRDMNREQLEDVYGIIHDISAMLTDATRQIGKAERISNYEAGQEVIANMRDVKAKGLTTNKISTFFREWMTNPMRAVKEMSGFGKDARLVKMFDELNEGRRKADTFRMESTKKFDALRSGKTGKTAFDDAVQKAAVTVTDQYGDEAKISKMQAMQAILTYYREQNNKHRSHLDSPVRFTDVDLEVKGKYTEAFDRGKDIVVDSAFVAKVMDQLSDWDKQYLETARSWLNNEAKDAINEVSLVTRHRIVAAENDYIPYYLNDDYIAKESDNVKFDATIDSMGIMKSVKSNATQQLVMRGLNVVLADHIDKVAKIYGLMIPVRNFNKIFNMKQTRDDGGNTVKSAISATWGKNGEKLVDQAVADVQSNRRADSVAAVGGIKSAFVVSTLASNLSVWMKQAASYPTAGSILSAGSLTKALPNFVRNLEATYEEIDQHTSQHWIRRQGLSTQELGEMNQSRGWANRLNEKMGNWSPMNWIQSMDVKTTAVLWEACKNEVESRGLTQEDDGYWTQVTDLYDRVIEETQPMYDPLHRAEITKNPGLKNIIMFQTQPIQNSGILRDGALQYKMAKKEFGANSEEAKAAGAEFKKAVTSQLASHFVFTAMTLTAAALLHRMDPYRDEDDELTSESVLKKFAEDYASNVFNAIVPVIGNYAITATQKVFGGSRYDILSDPVVDKINTSFDYLARLKNPSFTNFTNVFCDIASYFGIPAKNAYNIINGAVLHARDTINGDFFSFETGVDRTNTQDIRRMYNAFMDGNTAKTAQVFRGMLDEYIAKGKTETEAKSTIQSSVTTNIKPLFLQAYEDKDNDKMAEIRRFLNSLGLYKDVVKTTQDWIKKSKDTK